MESLDFSITKEQQEDIINGIVDVAGADINKFFAAAAAGISSVLLTSNPAEPLNRPGIEGDIAQLYIYLEAMIKANKIDKERVDMEVLLAYKQYAKFIEEQKEAIAQAFMNAQQDQEEATDTTEENNVEEAAENDEAPEESECIATAVPVEDVEVVENPEQA